MATDKFRIGLVFTPNRIISVGVLNGNDREAYEFIGKIQPLIDDFMGRVRKAAAYKQGKLDKFVSESERRNTSSSEV
jgi:hypothetical protein